MHILLRLHLRLQFRLHLPPVADGVADGLAVLLVARTIVAPSDATREVNATVLYNRQLYLSANSMSDW